jgi:hypothetical protein
MAQIDGFIGLDKFMLGLRDIPKEFEAKRATINAAAKVASDPAKADAKAMIKSTTTKQTKSFGGFKKLLFLSRALKTYHIKSRKTYGVSVRFQDGLSIPIGSNKNGSLVRWNVQGFGKLLAKGSHITGERKKKDGSSTGTMPGFGNWVKIAQNKHKKTMAVRWALSIKTIIGKTAARAFKRRGL